MKGDANTVSRKVINNTIAGLTVAVILIPQAMAYAVLGGMPAVYGLYASLVPLIIYPIFSSSKELSVGPVALTSIILLASLSTLAEPFSPQYIELAILTAFMTGCFQLIFYSLRLDTLSNFLARPVLKGFISASGIIIILSQLKNIIGCDIAYYEVSEWANVSGCINPINLILSIVTIAFILLTKRFLPRLPNYLIVVVFGLILMNSFSWDVAVIGEIPRGLPQFSVEFVKWDNIKNVFPAALILSVICFITSYSIAKSINDVKDAELSARKELLGLGLSKVVGSFFMAMPTSGSFSRSAINDSAGSTSPLSSWITATVVGIVLLFFSSILANLPMAILSAIIVASIVKFVDYREAIRLWYEDRIDFYTMIVTFLATLLLGIVNGVVVGIIISLLIIIIRSSRPNFVELGRLPGTTSYRNILRYEDTIVSENTMILRYDQNLYFANSEPFYVSIMKQIEERNPSTLILHFGSVHTIDSTAMYMLDMLLKQLHERNITLKLTNVYGPLRDKLFQSRKIGNIPKECFYLSVADAMGDHDVDVIGKSSRYAKQYFDKENRIKDRY